MPCLYPWQENRNAAAAESVLLFGRIPQIAKDINRDRIWVIPPKWIRNVFPVVALLHHHRRTGAGKDRLLAGNPFKVISSHRLQRGRKLLNNNRIMNMRECTCCCWFVLARGSHTSCMAWPGGILPRGDFFVLLAAFSFFLLRNRLSTTTSGKQQSSGWKYERNSPPNAELRKFAVN